MKPQFFRLSTLFCLLLLWVVSCKKEEPPVTPGGTTPPGSTTGTTTTKSTAKAISAFTFNSLSPAVNAVIDATAKTISATVTSGTDVTKLVPTLTISDKATTSPTSGVAQDFSKAVTYTVTAEDGSTQAYTTTVSVAAAANACRAVAETGTSNDFSFKRTYEVDAQNRLTKSVLTQYTSTGTVSSIVTIAQSYDAAGYRTQEKSTYNYLISSGKNDFKDQLLTETYANGRLEKSVFAATYVDASVAGFGFTYQYEYDAQGKISKRIYSSGNTEEIITIANGVVTGISGKGSVYEVNAQGFVSRKTAADGSFTVYKYNAAGQQTANESYNAKGVKTAYYIYEYGTTRVNLPSNPAGFKGHPTEVASAYGATGLPKTKDTYYTVDASGKETLILQTFYTWKVDRRGNLVKSTLTSGGAFGTPRVVTYTYQYEGCQ